MGAKKVLAMLKGGGHNTFEVLVNAGAGFSHAEGGAGGIQKFPPFKKKGGGGRRESYYPVLSC